MGYNSAIATTTTFIRAIYAATGAAADGNQVAQLVANQRDKLGMVPPKFVFDKAAGSPKIFAQVSWVSEGQTQLVARLIGQSSRRERFGPLDFVLGDDLTLTCPNGQVAAKRTYIKQNQGWQYRFLADQCDGCPLVARCRSPKAKPRSRRVVFISDYRVFHQEALDYTLTAAFEQEIKLRPNVERIIAGVTRYNNGRYARGYGLQNADYQVKMAAVAYNVKRWHKLHLQQQKEQRYQPTDVT